MSLPFLEAFKQSPEENMLGTTDSKRGLYDGSFWAPPPYQELLDLSSAGCLGGGGERSSSHHCWTAKFPFLLLPQERQLHGTVVTSAWRRSYPMSKVRSGGCEEIPYIQGTCPTLRPHGL